MLRFHPLTLDEPLGGGRGRRAAHVRRPGGASLGLHPRARPACGAQGGARRTGTTPYVFDREPARRARSRARRARSAGRGDVAVPRAAPAHRRPDRGADAERQLPPREPAGRRSRTRPALRRFRGRERHQPGARHRGLPCSRTSREAASSSSTATPASGARCFSRRSWDSRTATSSGSPCISS